jgi:hypothetical protein
VIVTPVAMEVWMSSCWNDRGHVGSGRGFRAPVDCTVTSVPSVGAGATVGASPWLTVLPEGYTCPSGEAEIS